jgi:aminoglycoside 6'-N-acetyltransferase I
VQAFLGELRRVWTAMIDGWVVNRAQHAIGDIRGPGDLKKVAAGLMHDCREVYGAGGKYVKAFSMGFMPDIAIRLARPSDLDQLARMREALWPETSADEHARELTLIFSGEARLTMPLINLVADAGDGVLAGFLEADLRSHADGCDPAQPVGYVEGWYVAEPFRNRGTGAALLAAAEDWARSQGCVEMASDTWIDNEISQRVHQSLGFEVVDRCVHYRKPL